MKRFEQVVLVLVCLYLLYGIKSALGINISQRYHAIDLVKIPLKVVVKQLKADAPKPECLNEG